MSWLKLVPFAVCTFLGVTAAPAQVTQTAVFDFYVMTSGGLSKTCGLEFNYAYRDMIYRNGGWSGISGSLNWSDMGDWISLIVKINGMVLA